MSCSAVLGSVAAAAFLYESVVGMVTTAADPVRVHRTLINTALVALVSFRPINILTAVADPVAGRLRGETLARLGVCPLLVGGVVLVLLLVVTCPKSAWLLVAVSATIAAIVLLFWESSSRPESLPVVPVRSVPVIAARSRDAARRSLRLALVTLQPIVVVVVTATRTVPLRVAVRAPARTRLRREPFRFGHLTLVTLRSERVVQVVTVSTNPVLCSVIYLGRHD